MIQNELIIS